MNLSLPFFDLPASPLPGALPQTRVNAAAGVRVGIPPAAVVATEVETETSAAGAAAPRPLAGAGFGDPLFEDPLDAVSRAARASLLHPSLWRASQIGAAPQRVTVSGFAALDAQLPGGGWPHGVLTELLLPQPGVGELRLLAPALAALGPAAAAATMTAAKVGASSTSANANAAPAPSDEGRCVMLFDPPASLCAWALVQAGLSSQHWLVVHSRPSQGRPAAPRSANRLSPLLAGADLLWALEQALKSGHVGAILAWLPLVLRGDALRRLQIAAQAHDGPVFVLRDAQARNKPSAAPLRLLLQPAGVDGLLLRLLKRRGPPLAQPLRLALPPVLTPQQQAQAQARLLAQRAAHV